MDKMQRSSSNSKFSKGKNDGTINATHDADDEHMADDDVVIHLKKMTSDMFLDHNTITIRASSAKTPPKTDLNIEPNTASNSLKVEALPRLQEHQDKSTFVDSSDKKVKRTVECKSLSEYLNEHERFLKLIEHTRRLKRSEQKKLDIQKENLKKLRNQLTKEIEGNNLKRRYEKKKQTDALRKRRTFLRIRIQEAQLKESRKPRVQTSFFVSIKPLTPKSQLTQEKTTDKLFGSSSLATINQSKSTSYMSTRDSTRESRFRTNVACQTVKTSYSDVLYVERQLKEIKKPCKEPADIIGKNMEELIIQFVEHSKLSWKND